MARNPVQFQKGISLNEFLSLYGTEQQCFDALYRWRWPNGFVCPNCGHDRGCQLTTHKLQQCYRCNRQTSITAGTIFEATKLPLTVWFHPSLTLAHAFLRGTGGGGTENQGVAEVVARYRPGSHRYMYGELSSCMAHTVRVPLDTCTCASPARSAPTAPC